MRTRELSLVYLRTEDGGRGPHRHVAIFNDAGDGVTSDVDGHSHRICGLELEPAADGHTHGLSDERVDPREGPVSKHHRSAEQDYRDYFARIVRPS